MDTEYKGKAEIDQAISAYFRQFVDETGQVTPELLATYFNLPLDAIKGICTDMYKLQSQPQWRLHAILGALVFGAWAAETVATRKAN